MKSRNGLIMASAVALVLAATVVANDDGSTVAHEFLTGPVQQLALGHSADLVPHVQPVQLAVLFQSNVY